MAPKTEGTNALLTEKSRIEHIERQLRERRGKSTLFSDLAARSGLGVSYPPTDGRIRGKEITGFIVDDLEDDSPDRRKLGSFEQSFRDRVIQDWDADCTSIYESATRAEKTAPILSDIKPTTYGGFMDSIRARETGIKAYPGTVAHVPEEDVTRRKMLEMFEASMAIEPRERSNTTHPSEPAGVETQDEETGSW